MRKAHFTGILCAILLGACSDGSGPPLHFVLPDGFTGEVRIVKDLRNGMEVRKEAGRFVFEIPSNGELRVRSLEPFGQWHKVSVTFQNGTPLLSNTDDNVPNDAIAFRSLGMLVSSNVTSVHYYVGAKEDQHMYQPK